MSMRELAEDIAYAFDVSARDILSRHRGQPVVSARFALYKLLYDNGSSLRQIGAMFKRDHKAVFHGVRRAKYMMEKDEGYLRKVEAATKGGAKRNFNERTVILSWMRGRANKLMEWGEQEEAFALQDAADAIERGEHIG